MSKGTKITSFFEGRRREAFLRSWEHLKSTAGESRIKLDIKIPLLNRSVQGFPDAVSKQYSVMCEDKTSTARANLDIYCEGMTMEIFTTDTAKERVAMSTGTLFKNIHLVTAGEGDKRTLDLIVRVYLPANIDVRDWAWEHLHGTFFLEAIYSQSEMEFGEADGPDPEDDDDEEDEEPTEEENVEISKASDSFLDFKQNDPEPAFAGVGKTTEAAVEEFPW